MRRRVIWQVMETQILTDFSILTNNVLRNLTLSVCHIKQGKLYIEEHLRVFILYELFVHKERSAIIRVQLQSAIMIKVFKDV